MTHTASPTASGPRPAILVVDDDPDLRFLLSDMLTQAGYPVRTASEGGDALTQVGSVPPDLVITDLVMPGMKGTDLIQMLARDPRTAAIPTILLTATEVAAAQRDIERAGVQTVLVSKPVLADQLLEIIWELLDARTPASA